MAKRVATILLIVFAAFLFYSEAVFESFFQRIRAGVYDPCSDTMYLLELEPVIASFLKREWRNPFSEKPLYKFSEVDDVYNFTERRDETRRQDEKFLNAIQDSASYAAYMDSFNRKIQLASSDSSIEKSVEYHASRLFDFRTAMIIPPNGDFDCDPFGRLPEELEFLFDNEDWEMDEVRLIGFVYAEKAGENPLSVTVHNKAIMIRGEAFYTGMEKGCW